MTRKAICLVVLVVGLTSFFLPLVRVQSPILGTQRISGWDVVKPGDERGRSSDLGLDDSLERLQRDVLRQKTPEVPFAIQQAQSLVVALPVAYLALIAGAGFLLMRKSRWTQITAAIGLLACVWSFVSVAWLSSGVKEVVAGAGGSRMPVLGRLITRSVAEKTSVGAEWGLYVLAASVVALLVVSFIRSNK